MSWDADDPGRAKCEVLEQMVRIAYAATAALAVFIAVGCEGGGGGDGGKKYAKPTNIAGVWHGYDYGNLIDLETRLTLRQNGSTVTGKKDKASQTSKDLEFDVTGTYDADTGILTITEDWTVIDDKTVTYRFLDENTMEEFPRSKNDGGERLTRQ